MSEFDTERTEYPVCPKCGFSDQDWWDGLGPGKGDGDSWVAQCGSCEHEYRVTMCIETTFSTVTWTEADSARKDMQRCRDREFFIRHFGRDPELASKLNHATVLAEMRLSALEPLVGERET